MNKKKINNIIIIKIIRAIILLLTVYFVMKYFTIGKIPYNEILMVASSAVLVQTLLDIYRPIIIINENID